jgi:hypothetical protein
VLVGVMLLLVVGVPVGEVERVRGALPVGVPDVDDVAVIEAVIEGVDPSVRDGVGVGVPVGVMDTVDVSDAGTTESAPEMVAPMVMGGADTADASAAASATPK